MHVPDAPVKKKKKTAQVELNVEVDDTAKPVTKKKKSAQVAATIESTKTPKSTNAAPEPKKAPKKHKKQQDQVENEEPAPTRKKILKRKRDVDAVAESTQQPKKRKNKTSAAPPSSDALPSSSQTLASSSDALTLVEDDESSEPEVQLVCDQGHKDAGTRALCTPTTGNLKTSLPSAKSITSVVAPPSRGRRVAAEFRWVCGGLGLGAFFEGYSTRAPRFSDDFGDPVPRRSGRVG
ncbi:hypothetical protein FB45DRAFT_897689 [Roridomyces roridus]|uniref:Uncharacterized protein n=1 Tax=Roridomyces roridus TaxID=1738132 RepID=A0AAD7CBE5_9AGAR|nr:hypothetical protein FB45DRAFT_897689 [Roridomyces roridus]